MGIIFDQQNRAYRRNHVNLRRRRRLLRPFDVERRSGAGCRLGPDPATHFVDYLLDNGESSPRTLELLLPDQPVEQSEHPVVVLHVEPDPVISNHEQKRADALLAGDANRGRAGCSAVLERIVDQIRQHLKQAALPRADASSHRD